MRTYEKRNVQFVVKSSKFCNLRCRYCYEYAELGSREAITLEQLEQMFKNIFSHYSQLNHATNIDFIWHGGEPLLQHPDYYWRAFELQRKIFRSLNGSIRNCVQTNLTTLNQERLRLLKEGFDAIGVSVDLFGDLRVTQRGVTSQPVVMANMEWLRQEGISFACLTVLTKLNLPHLQEIYDFYATREIAFRVLPLFEGAFDGQHQGYEISPEEVLAAFCTLAELSLTSQKPVRVSPIDEYIRQVIYHHCRDSAPSFYDKREWESIYLVNTNGDIYSYSDAYNPEFRHGNLFTTPLTDIIHSPAHNKVIAAAEQRMASACSSCSYYGECSGYPMAEESVGYNLVDEYGNARCVQVKGTLEYVENRLKQIGFINPITRKLSFAASISPSASVAEPLSVF
ncbi:radical SAM protein [Leptolyngbya sp. 7M]|uniref:radical SAM protein n=1 Tax=Leptolyngbya sp. 7M TaxID=2812896 RepID=UPI001B8AFA82|nr:radical SAM protein [Leptolyngbya sp. 7M]QYO66883.1 radical SAM protein [Leptolyngbya sp. 7M]